MKNLKMLRGKLGLTQAELAEKLDLCRPYISMLERDEVTDLSDDVTQKACELFGVTPCELYGINNLKYMPKDRDELERFIEVLRRDYK